MSEFEKVMKQLDEILAQIEVINKGLRNVKEQAEAVA